MRLCYWDNRKVPLSAKRKRGATRKTSSALQIQPNELQAGGITEYCNDDDASSYAEPSSQIQPTQFDLDKITEKILILYESVLVNEPMVENEPKVIEHPIKLTKKKGRKPNVPSNYDSQKESVNIFEELFLS